MNVESFFYRQKVFRTEEFLQFCKDQGQTNLSTQQTLLKYHLKAGHVLRIRRGLYAVVPPLSDPETCPVDPYLIASKVTSDSVLAYHTAMDYHGLSYSIYFQFTYLSKHKVTKFNFRNENYMRVCNPSGLLKKGKENFGVKIGEREGVEIKVTNLERTAVDVLDRPELSGGWEEVWRSLENIPVLDLDVLVDYVFLLGNATSIAKVGYFLEEHKQLFAVDESYLNKLQKRVPAKTHYMDRTKRTTGKLVKRWNLIVPNEIIEKSWEEPNDYV